MIDPDWEGKMVRVGTPDGYSWTGTLTRTTGLWAELANARLYRYDGAPILYLKNVRIADYLVAGWATLVEDTTP